MVNKRQDIICSVIFLIFGGVMMFLSLRIPKMIESDVGSWLLRAQSCCSPCSAKTRRKAGRLRRNSTRPAAWEPSH